MYEQQDTNIRTRIIETKFGSIFSREVGELGQPLIMIIHGSGPKNSHAQYLPLLQEYLVRIAYFQRFFITAIDCPGYGSSGGSKQAIKTFPLEMMQEILKQLGYKNYFALYGHSQGGAAIFNAVYQCPSLCEYMVQDRPVCGNIQRFRKFQVPTLLIYDIQDDGHPIWQGKLLYKQLKNSEFHTYRSSKSPYWAQDNMWNLMLAFFDKWRVKNQRKNNYMRSISSSYKVSRVSNRKVQANSLEKLEKQKLEREKIEFEEIKEMEESFYSSQQYKNESREEEIIEEKIIPKNKKVQNNIYAQNNQCSNLILKDVDIVQSVEKKQTSPMIIKQIKEQPKPIFNNPNNERKQEIVIGKKSLQKKQKKISQEQQQKFEEQNKCCLCYQRYFHPTRINCNHIFCWKCITQAMLVNPRCPLCRRDIQKRTQLKQLHQQMVQKLGQQTLSKRIAEYNKFSRMMQSIVFIQLGNTSVALQTKQSSFSNIKKKFNWQLFVIQPKNFKFESVQFNINMGEPNIKPIKVKNAPWVYQSRGTFSFSCEIIINPKSTEYARQVVVYRIDIAQGRHSKRIAIRKKQFAG